MAVPSIESLEVDKDENGSLLFLFQIDSAPADRTRVRQIVQVDRSLGDISWRDWQNVGARVVSNIHGKILHTAGGGWYLAFNVGVDGYTFAGA